MFDVKLFCGYYFTELKMGNAWAAYARPEITPNNLQPPSFDPLLGFENGRKERGIIIYVIKFG